MSACVEVWILCCAHVSVGFIASSLQFIFDSSHDIKFEKKNFFFCILASFGEMKLTSHHSLNHRQKLEIHAFFSFQINYTEMAYLEIGLCNLGHVTSLPGLQAVCSLLFLSRGR